MALYNATCAPSFDMRMAVAGDVTAAKDRRPSTYFIEPLIAGLRAYVIGTHLSVLDRADQLGRTDAEWFWSWQ